MDREDIIRMAMEADPGFNVVQNAMELLSNSIVGIAAIERFAALVAAHEREECASVAESYEPTCDTCPSGVANAIRARGKK